jgi:hypothetical protein
MKRTEQQRLEHIMYRMQTDGALDAPADAITFAKNLYRTRMTRPAATVVERIMAVLKVDLAPNRAAFGERSAGEGQDRQMLFDSGEAAIDLRVRATDKGFNIRGQVLGTGFENGKIELLGPATTARGSISKDSQFELADVPAGDYSMSIKADDKEIFIGQLVLG